MMFDKVLVVLCALFLTQWFCACEECNDVRPSTLEIGYDGLTVEAMDLTGFRVMVLTETDTVHPSSFGIQAMWEITTNQLADSRNLISGYGFSQATACSPSRPHLIFTDTIANIQVWMNNPADNSRLDVTNQFGVLFDAFDQIITTEEVVHQMRQRSREGDYPVNYMFLQFIAYEQIPASASFELRLSFSSGEVLSSTTDVVAFEQN